MTEIDQFEQEESGRTFEFPQREPWSSAAVKLLKGVVYHDGQGNAWDEILANVSRLTDYFGRLGLVLIVNEEDGMACLHQPDAEELPADYESIPKLFHKVALEFEGTLLCIVLRDELRRNEEEELQNERPLCRQAIRSAGSLANVLSRGFRRNPFERRFVKAACTTGKTQVRVMSWRTWSNSFATPGHAVY